MPSTVVYLDTNQFVRVFERESETLFPRFATAMEQNSWRLAVSEANILEVYQGVEKGANPVAVYKGLELLDSLRPLWLRTGALDIKELRTAFTQYRNGEQFRGISPYLCWREFLAEISNSRHVFIMLNLAFSPPSYVFDYLYGQGVLLGHARAEYWQSELDSAGTELRRLIKGKARAKARRDEFIETVIHTCKPLSEDGRQLRRFAEELWDRPGVCPGFRLGFEVTFSLLGDYLSSWTTNRFFDQRHILAIPYVDKFVGLDRGQRSALAEFDRIVGTNAGIDFSSRCYRRVEELVGES